MEMKEAEGTDNNLGNKIIVHRLCWSKTVFGAENKLIRYKSQIGFQILCDWNFIVVFFQNESRSIYFGKSYE